MYQVACPGCGAPVSFRSTASVMAVCEFCRTTLVKDAESVRDLGKMAEVLEDYSPIRIGVSGVFNGHGFTVVGRIQLRYSAGFWNEWYVISDEGRGAWLSDASGQYAITADGDAPGALPRFANLRPGAEFKYGNTSFIAADVRTARCVAGQGELPFTVGPGWEAKVADFRRGKQFLTLDYSDCQSENDPPKVYRGTAVKLDDLKCQLLRAPEEIQDTAGRFKGKVGSLACPACGANANYTPGATTHLVCPACHAQVDTSGAVAEVLAKGEEMEAVATSFKLGDKAKIDGQAYSLIGLMQRSELDDDESVSWTEYLLYSEKKGFLWLVETLEEWALAEVLDEWPNYTGGGQVSLPGEGFNKLYDYAAEVRFVSGAFNWRVALGDRNFISEFKGGKTSLAMERSAEELTWSRSRTVGTQEVMSWFGRAKPPTEAQKAAAASSSGTGSSCLKQAKWMMIVLLVVNFIPLLVVPGTVLGAMFFSAVFLYLPAIVIEAIVGKHGDKQ